MFARYEDIKIFALGMNLKNRNIKNVEKNLIVSIRSVVIKITGKFKIRDGPFTIIPISTKNRTSNISRKGLIAASGAKFFPSSDISTPAKKAAIASGSPAYVKTPIDRTAVKSVARIVSSCCG
jgi:hypothetical protein